VNNKFFASVSGVCIATAVVIGGAVAAATHHDPQPQTPAGQPLAPASTVTATATVTASPTPTVVAKVSPSTKAVAPKRRAVVVPNEGDPVTDPTTPDPQPAETTTAPPEQTIDNGTGSTDEGGIRRAPAPSQKVHSVPPPEPQPIGPGAPGGHS
jgi:hypothetical protein